MRNLHWTDPAFKTMSDADQERTLRNSLTAKPGAREWIGIFTWHGDVLRELDYPGYARQRYDGSAHFSFVFKDAPGPLNVAAMGLFHDATGERTKPIIIHLVANQQVFTVRPADTVRVEVGQVLG